jgi:hypothetical protein
LAKRFQRRRFFLNRPIRNKNCLWWPCLLTDQDEMSYLYRGPSLDASYQDSVHLAKWYHRQFLFLIGRFLKYLLLWNHFPKWTEIWLEGPFIMIAHFVPIR